MADEHDSKKTVQTLDDVTKAEKVPASATARPIIVSHGAMMKDPMVQEPKDTPKPEKSTESIEPPSRVEKKLEPETKPEDSQPTNELEKTEADAAETAKDSSQKKAEDEDAVKPSSSAAVDALVDEVIKDKDSKKDTAEEAERREHIEKLVAEKKYFIKPSASNEQKSTRLVITLFVLLLLALGGLELAVDAGLIDIGIDPIVDLIK